MACSYGLSHTVIMGGFYPGASGVMHDGTVAEALPGAADEGGAASCRVPSMRGGVQASLSRLAGLPSRESWPLRSCNLVGVSVVFLFPAGHGEIRRKVMPLRLRPLPSGRHTRCTAGCGRRLSTTAWRSSSRSAGQGHGCHGPLGAGKRRAGLLCARAEGTSGRAKCCFRHF